MTEKTAHAAAKDFLIKQKLSDRYFLDDPVIHKIDGEFYVEFQDKQEDTEPGVCIIAIDKNTGKPRIEPVE